MAVVERTKRRLPSRRELERFVAKIPRESIPVIGPERIEEVRRWLESQPPRSPDRGVKGETCPFCGEPTLDFSDKMTMEWDSRGGHVLIRDLTGLECGTCGEKLFDPAASRVISRTVESQRPATGYSGTVSSLGGGKLGIYLPADVVSGMGLRRGLRIRMTPVSKKRLVVELVSGKGEDSH